MNMAIMKTPLGENESEQRELVYSFCYFSLDLKLLWNKRVCSKIHRVLTMTPLQWFYQLRAAWFLSQKDSLCSLLPLHVKYSRIPKIDFSPQRWQTKTLLSSKCLKSIKPARLEIYTWDNREIAVDLEGQGESTSVNIQTRIICNYL